MILINYGTRPEWLKVKPVIDQCRLNGVAIRVLQIRQHTDLLDGCTFDRQLSLKMDMGTSTGNRLDKIVQCVVNKDGVFDEISHVLVQGDTTSAFAMALAAFHRQIPVIHLEAGLRSYSTEPYPEEFNRRAISSIASIHLCPTERDKENLQQEQVNGQIHVTGNTILDTLKDVKVSDDNLVLITMHRRENHKNLEEWFTAFNMLQKENPHLRFVFVSHPSPAVAEKTHLLLNIDILPPVTHDEFLELLASAAVVITDSGGVQEEASFLGKRHIVCREHTERPTGYRCKKPYELPGIGLNGGVFYRLLESNNWWQKCPYGCGNSAQKVVEVLKCL